MKYLSTRDKTLRLTAAEAIKRDRRLKVMVVLRVSSEGSQRALRERASAFFLDHYEWERTEPVSALSRFFVPFSLLLSESTIRTRSSLGKTPERSVSRAS